MWIMLIKDLPILNPPPKYSIFWSTAWPNEGMIEMQEKHKKYFDDWPDEAEITTDDVYIPTPFGFEPNWRGARAIIFGGEKIRVFPHEFTAQSNQNLNIFINIEQAYELVPDNVAEERQIKLVLDGELKPIYEQALLDGANHNWALLTLLEHDISMPDADFPPVGYYVLKDHVRELLP